ncbi:hypothetical protein DFH09DRAFT_1335460 [Mycena vulgaris]|nr:hypothetical protein DFH09DRAFT_1335460 [Mycena vulgaris]
MGAVDGADGGSRYVGVQRGVDGRPGAMCADLSSLPFPPSPPLLSPFAFISMALPPSSLLPHARPLFPRVSALTHSSLASSSLRTPVLSLSPRTSTVRVAAASPVVRHQRGTQRSQRPLALDTARARACPSVVDASVPPASLSARRRGDGAWCGSLAWWSSCAGRKQRWALNEFVCAVDTRHGARRRVQSIGACAPVEHGTGCLFCFVPAVFFGAQQRGSFPLP